MPDLPKPFTILMADDDAEDCLLVRDTLRESGLRHHVEFVANGEELLDYLHRCEEQGGVSRTGAPPPSPDLILLDLNMPRMDGREVLRELKQSGEPGRCPIVVLTTSTAEEDVGFCYQMGANSYITKPATYQQWVDLIGNLTKGARDEG